MTITVTVSYPNTLGSKFDMDYYLATHLELIGKCRGNKLISARYQRYRYAQPGHAATLSSGRYLGA